jgi:hypothetical protein
VIPVRRSLSTRWISVLTLVALVVIWWAVTATGMIEPLFLPPPSAVLQKGWLLATSGYMDSTLWQHLGASLSRIGLGLGFAVLTAVPVGIAIGHNRIARGILDPLIEFYRPIPPLAYLPLIVIWCGIGELSKVLLIYSGDFRADCHRYRHRRAHSRPSQIARRAVVGRDPRAVDSPRDSAERLAGHFDRRAHWPWVSVGRRWSPPN